MKHSICGFNHAALILNFKLNYDDALIIRCIIDFRDTGKMDMVTVEGKQYFWVYYNWILEELPMLPCTNKRTLARWMDKYVDNGLMEKRVISGNRTYYRFIENSLLNLQNYPVLESTTPCQKIVTPVLQSPTPCTPESNPPVLQSPTIDPSLNNPSLNIKRIFEHWNSRQLIKHKSISKAMAQNITDRLKESTVDELIKCIDNYNAVVNNARSWYTYRSALDDFFRDGVKKPAPYLKFMPERFVATNFIKEQKDAQQTLFDDDDIPAKPTYPETSVIMNKLYSLFPGGHEYLFFPQDSDTAAWRLLHDLVLTKPREQQKWAVIEAMKVLEKK